MKYFKHRLLVPILLFSSFCFGQTYQDYFHKGKVEKDPAKKISYFTQAIAASKTDSAFYYRAVARHDQKQYQEAIADYDQAIHLNPSFVWAFVGRGKVKRELKRYEQAMADFDIAISLDKDYDYAYANRGYIEYDLGKYAEAVFDLDKAIRLDPDYSEYFFNRGLTYRQLDKHIEALYDFERVTRLNPENDNGYYASGYEKLQLGRYQQAIADFDQVIKMSPKDAAAYNSRGVAKENLGRYDAAISDYEQAIRLDPKHEFAFNNKERAVSQRNAFAVNQYNAEPLGFKLGVTPLSDVRQKDHEMQEDGYSYWTGGKKFASKGTAHNIEGASKITYIFNGEDLLDAVIIEMHKDYFHQVNSYLKSKYKLVSATIPFVGDKHTKYKQGNSLIQINAPHLSFGMEVIYKTVNFDTALRNKDAADTMEKRTRQKSKF